MPRVVQYRSDVQHRRQAEHIAKRNYRFFRKDDQQAAISIFVSASRVGSGMRLSMPRESNHLKRRRAVSLEAMSKIRAGVLAGMLAVSPALCLLPSEALAFDPAPWTHLLLPAPIGYSPDDSTVCLNGDISCVDAVNTNLQAQLGPLLANCDHKLIFTFFLQYMVQTYRNAATTPGYFENTFYTNQEDALLASYYSTQYQAWINQDLSNVSPAWQIAFHANDDKTVSALGDALLSINAHLNHDAPYMLDQLGLVYPNGDSAKPDYDKSNDWLYSAEASAIDEGARRFDPTMNQPAVIVQPPFNLLSFQLIAGWREQAWYFATQLKLAEETNDSVLYKTTEAAIDAYTVAQAQIILAATRISAQQTASRDAYCAVHRYDP